MICVKEAADDLMIVPNHTCRKNRIIASYHHRAGVGRGAFVRWMFILLSNVDRIFYYSAKGIDALHVTGDWCE